MHVREESFMRSHAVFGLTPPQPRIEWLFVGCVISTRRPCDIAALVVNPSMLINVFHSTGIPHTPAFGLANVTLPLYLAALAIIAMGKPIGLQYTM